MEFAGDNLSDVKPQWSLLAIVVLGVVGCQPAAVSHVKDVPLDLPAGWTLAENKEHGMKVGVAPGWRSGVDSLKDSLGALGDSIGALANTPPPANGSGSSSTDGMNATLQGMARDIEQTAKEDEQKELERLASRGVYVHVIDSSKPIVGEERTRYYIKQVVGTGPADLESAAATERQHVLGSGSPEIVQLPIGKCLRLESEVTTKGGDKVHRISYVVVDGKSSYVLRFSSTNNPTSITAIDREVAKTWRIKPSKD